MSVTHIVRSQRANRTNDSYTIIIIIIIIITEQPQNLILSIIFNQNITLNLNPKLSLTPNLNRFLSTSTQQYMETQMQA